MSRAGRLRLLRLMRAQKSQELLAVMARELVPSCQDAARFFFDGIADFITAPVAESTASLTQEIGRRGATQLSPSVPGMANQFEALRAAALQAASASNFELPPILVQKPPIVTAEAVKIQEELLERIRRFEMIEGGDSPKVADLAERLQADQQRTQDSFAAACLVAGRHMDEPSHPVFARAQDLIALHDSSEREKVAAEIAQWAASAAESIQAELKESWTAVALAGCKLALGGVSGMATEEPNLADMTIRATDAADPSRGIDVRVDAQSGEITYDVFGYVKEACVPVEKAFLEQLSQVLGVDIGVTSLRHWSTVEGETTPDTRLGKTPRRTDAHPPEEEPQRQPGGA